MALVYTEIARDPFQRPNENPLNPAKWSATFGPEGGPLAVNSDLCISPSILNGGGELWTGDAIPPNQYSECTIRDIIGETDIAVRSNLDTNTATLYYLAVQGFDNFWQLVVVVDGVYEPLREGTLTPVAGDKMRIEAFGSTITAVYNGQVLATVEDSQVTSGSPGVYIYPENTPTDTSISLYTAGVITEAVPGGAGIRLPFSKRMTAAAAVFACLAIASPRGAQQLTTIPATIAALALSYAQLIKIYPALIHQDTANNLVDLYAAIGLAVIAVGALNTTLQAMSASGDAGVQLRQMQIVVANALSTLNNVQADE